MNGWEDELEEEFDDELAESSESQLEDRAGHVEAINNGKELVLSWVGRGNHDGIEMLRFNRAERLLRIFPRIRISMAYSNPHKRIKEIQIESDRWDPLDHSVEGERLGLLHVVGLPRGFSATYLFGLGIMRAYRGLLDELEQHTDCEIIRFTSSGTEGPKGNVFRLSLDRFEAYRQIVERNRGRGSTAVARVIAAEAQNSVCDLFGLDQVQPKYGTHPVIRAITEEVASGYVVDASQRAALVDRVVLEAPTVAQESPQRFGQLREDIELVSLEVLIKRFGEGLVGRAARDEEHWQRFFVSNPFALQQIFSAPILLLAGQVHVRGTDAFGRGARIADLLCVNTITRSAVVVEIKTPAALLMANKAYRGSDTAEVYPVHRELGGAVSQVQAQMESVPRDLEDHSELGMIDKWHTRGAVITGRVSELNDEQRASFLRYREGFTAVTVLGYDEVLQRLEGLHALLKASR